VTIEREIAEIDGASLLMRHTMDELRSNRVKGLPVESVERLLRLAQSEIDEVLHALRSGRGLDAVLSEIGDAGAYLALAAWKAKEGAR